MNSEHNQKISLKKEMEKLFVGIMMMMMWIKGITRMNN